MKRILAFCLAVSMTIPVMGQVLKGSKPAAPTVVKNVSMEREGKEVVITWKETPGAASYEVLRTVDLERGPAKTFNVPAGTLSFRDSEPVPGAYYSVVMVTKDGKRAQTGWQKAPAMAKAPAAAKKAKK
jgi:hypothetical protein